jgi:inactivated superfamily I helicase
MGYEWLLGLLASQNKKNADYKFACVVTQLAAIEARILLDRLPETSKDYPQHSLNMLTSCYELVESTIEFLTNSSEDDVFVLFPSEALLSLKSSLDGLFDAIISFLLEKLVGDHCK